MCQCECVHAYVCVCVCVCVCRATEAATLLTVVNVDNGRDCERYTDGKQAYSDMASALTAVKHCANRKRAKKQTHAVSLTHKRQAHINTRLTANPGDVVSLECGALIGFTELGHASRN